MLKQEWKSLFHNKILLLVVIVIALIPAIYAGLFLASMWDPYGNVDKLPVAIVNEDEPAEYGDTTLTVGDQLVDEIDINRSTFYLHYTDIYQMLQSIEGELMEDILEAIKEHPLDPGMKEEGYSFAIQLFRILAANKDICAALMGPNGDMAFVEKIEKLVEDAVLPELFTMFPQNVNDIKYAYAFCINGCVGMIKCWLTGDSDDTPEHMAYLTHNIISEAPRNFAAKVLNSAQERTTV